MNTFINFVVNILGIVIFLFIFWKRLKEDFSSEVIFKIASYILIGIGTTYFLARGFFPNFFLWAMFLGGVVGMGVTVFTMRIKFFETFESFIISILPWLGISFLFDSVTHSSLSSFLAFIVILLILFLAYYFDTHYKSFTWYKSGKIGFSGLAILAIIFLIRSSLAIFRIGVISLVGFNIEAIVSGIGFLICLLLLFNLGRVRE